MDNYITKKNDELYYNTIHYNTIMATYIKLQFNDNVTFDLSTSSFLYKQSTFLQAFDIDEDNMINILCPSSCVLDENKIFLFNDKVDLSFMFTLDTKHFINVCKFLDIIHYDNIDNNFSEQFIIYVMEYLKEEIKDIQYFMQAEIRSIIKYNNNKHLVKCCTPIFYKLYLTEYKEEVIEYNRIDIFELSLNKSEYYRYIHKYDNHLTFIVKETKEYNDYITNISNQLIEQCEISNNIKNLSEYNATINVQLNNIKDLIECGADVNFHNKNIIGELALHAASYYTTLEVVKYLVEHGANIYLQGSFGWTALFSASDRCNNLEIVKYLVEYSELSHNSTNYINIRDKNNCIALHYASHKRNNLKVIKYLVENGANINAQDIYGRTALHNASMCPHNLETIKYLVENGADITLLDVCGCKALQYGNYTM